MKTLIVIRHAKSSWDHASVSDIDRPLNDRGKRDAPEMARRLIKKDITIDRFISSPAKRARQTAELFVHAFGRKEKEIHFVPELYHAAPETFEAVVRSLNDTDDCVAIFSHNPGITSFVNALSEARLDNMPTCAVFTVKNAATQWKDFFSEKSQFWFFEYPKSADAD